MDYQEARVILTGLVESSKKMANGKENRVTEALSKGAEALLICESVQRDILEGKVEEAPAAGLNFETTCWNCKYYDKSSGRIGERCDECEHTFDIDVRNKYFEKREQED